MEWISQNLFVGNRLAAGEIFFEEGKRPVNLRNIRSPIVVFASWGDNITPPQQALNWIPDLYENAQAIRDNEQTIVYVLHEKVGHLGIFVSAGVANREHSELMSALDLIDVLPPGLYEAIITDIHPDLPGLEYAEGRYVITFVPREVSDILALGDGREGERPFELVRHMAEINQKVYDTCISPAVKAGSNETTATVLRNLNSARLERQLFSDSNPMLKALKPLADSLRGGGGLAGKRAPVAADNPLLLWEQQVSRGITQMWDMYRDYRDAASEQMFKAIYESPFVAAAVGFTPQKSAGSKSLRPIRRTPSELEVLREKHARDDASFDRGRPETGFLRLLIYVSAGNGVVDGRPFNGIRRVMRELGLDKTVTLAQLKEAIKQQTYLVRKDESRALAGLLVMLPEKQQRLRALGLARELLVMGGPISAEKEGRLARVAQVLETELAA